jgi:hypothetical protein
MRSSYYPGCESASNMFRTEENCVCKACKVRVGNAKIARFSRYSCRSAATRWPPTIMQACPPTCVFSRMLLAKHLLPPLPYLPRCWQNSMTDRPTEVCVVMARRCWPCRNRHLLGALPFRNYYRLAVWRTPRSLCVQPVLHMCCVRTEPLTTSECHGQGSASENRHCQRSSQHHSHLQSLFHHRK